jgi:hypothetical protein
MLFLISYDRRAGTANWREYPDTDAVLAQKDRFEAETDAQRRGIPLEIVVLGARHKDDLKLTHAKYFGDDVLLENIRGQDVRRNDSSLKTG